MVEKLITYLFKRFLLIGPTLLGVLFINFLLVQVIPGGPVERIIAQIKGVPSEVDHANDWIRQSKGDEGKDSAQLDLVRVLKKRYEFDEPLLTRFVSMVKKYVVFDLGVSYFSETPVIDLILSKLTVSLTLGMWSVFLIYLISIPLGIHKALHDGTWFDIASSTIIIFLYAIPSFLLGIMFIIFFAGGNYFDWFPLKGLMSEGWEDFSFYHKVTDYLWHIVLPIMAIVFTSLAGVTLLTKNSFLDEIAKRYVVTARSKGLNRKQILYRHIFRNACIPLCSKVPHALIHIILSSSVLIEIVFSLDGLGFLCFESILNHDYPVMFGCLYIFTLLSLILHFIGDMLYSLVDPRIHFGANP